MLNTLTQHARNVITLADEESRRLGHEYVGTEHILLALLREPSYAGSGALARLGVSADAVREEVEKLVHRGPGQQAAGELAMLPLTPRAQRAIQTAAEEAANVSLSVAGPEHLLIGLIRDPDGVAGCVMRGMGLDVNRVRAESLRVRLRQMQIVERAVRPVRASVKRKRQMREELLVHLTAICDEEQQSGSPDVLAALDAAARRFGDPAELARELQASVPWSERFAYRVERWLGWRAPESVLRMMLRTSFISLAILAVAVGVPMLASVLIAPGGGRDASYLLRVFLALVLLTPVTQFAVGWCYYRTRDSLFGAFGTRRSLAAATLWSLAGGLAVFAAAIGFVAGLEGGAMRLMDTLWVASFSGIAMSVICALLARSRGPVEIRDATWQLLPVGTAS
jgi:ATP-dependent Clp protease ATP-binding subunit ClpC